MTVITIRNVPDDLNDTIKARARERGVSVQQLLLQELVALAERSPLEDRLRDALASLPVHDVPRERFEAALDAAREDHR